MSEHYEMQTRIDFVGSETSYDNFIASKELAKKGELRVLLSSFLEVYFNNPIEMANILERGTVTPDPVAQRRIEENKLKVLKDIALRQSYIDNSLALVENNNGKLLDYIDSNEFKKFKEQLSIEETEEQDVDKQYLSKDDLDLLENFESIKTQLNSIYYMVSGKDSSELDITSQLDGIETYLTEKLNDVFTNKIETMERKMMERFELLQDSINSSSRTIVSEEELRENKPVTKKEEVVDFKEEEIIKKEVIKDTPKEVETVKEEVVKEEDVIGNTEVDVTGALGMFAGLGIDEDLEEVSSYYTSEQSTVKPEQASKQEEKSYVEPVQSSVPSEQLKETTTETSTPIMIEGEEALNNILKGLNIE